ncbi:TetR/AcrR family transcriptional regulator [Phenylobacterium sp.]|jgi:AcrR family transcriptional regulator|uniref:TetR/AcrR family transcriptional regulator n=1 Tax=Phenylobacterium sp. TaxID=1871053 RepID=UPI0037830DE0
MQRVGEGMGETESLKVKPRPGTYARTASTVEQILNATLRVLTQEGYPALTLRRVAAESGFSLGRLHYHFPSKDSLLKGLLDAVLASYEDRAARTLDVLDLDDETRFKAGLFNVLRDIQSFQTTHLFPELWALANHDPELSARLHEFYYKARAPARRLLQRLNPTLQNEEDLETVVVFVACFVEGSAIFAGYGRPYAGKMPDLAAMALRGLFDVITTVTPAELASLRTAWAEAPAEISGPPAFLLQPRPR